MRIAPSVAALSMLLAPSIAYAGCATNYCENVKINTLIARESGDVLIELDSDTSTLNCTLAANGRITLLGTASGVDRIYALLLTKYISGDAVSRIRIVEESTGCRVSYVW